LTFHSRVLQLSAKKGVEFVRVFFRKTVSEEELEGGGACPLSQLLSICSERTCFSIRTVNTSKDH
jgi:hypothetical protein